MITSLTYVSRSRLQPGEQATVDAIVDVASSRNADLGVTGALLFTEVHFAQVLEGAPDAVEELMKSIEADPRHKDVTVLEHSAIDERRFPRWAMAYSGPSIYLDRHLKPLLGTSLHDLEKRQLVARLVALMESPGRMGTTSLRPF
jgi:hypothetical protein